MARPIVFVFARAPYFGTVKSRLARDIGHGHALRFHRNTLFSLCRRLCRDPHFDVMLAVTPLRAVRQSGLWPHGIRVVDQGQGDLGQRMIRVLRMAGTRPAVLIGSDIPHASPNHLRSAFAALGRSQFVLGPTFDGGYWLIGSRQPARLAQHQLSGVRWSSAHALEDTAARLKDVALLTEALLDIDDGADFSKLNGRERFN